MVPDTSIASNHACLRGARYDSHAQSLSIKRRTVPRHSAAGGIVRGSLSIPIPSAFVNQGARARARADVTVPEAQLQADYTLLESHVTQTRGAVVAAAQRVRSYGEEMIATRLCATALATSAWSASNGER
jgi:hypothetical protein